MVIRYRAMRSRKARKNHRHTHTHTHTTPTPYPHYTLLPHLDPLPTARLPNTHLKRIDGSGTTGLYENRRNVKRYVHPCRCGMSTLFISHYITLHCIACTFFPFISQSFIRYCCPSTIPLLSVRAPLSLFTAACRRLQAGKPRSTQHLPVSKTIAFLSLHFRAFTLRHFAILHTKIDTPSSAGR
jgi:hypothetical protein